jgi:hypothetical protein
MNMPITSKKQSQAKQDWLAKNSKVYGVRVMNNENEKDLWDFLRTQEAPATTIKIALREYMKNHKLEVKQPMTDFEMFCKELNVEIETDKDGLYCGMAKALAEMVNEVILSDEESLRNADWETQKEIVKKKFFSVFPYMESKEKT